MHICNNLSSSPCHKFYSDFELYNDFKHYNQIHTQHPKLSFFATGKIKNKIKIFLSRITCVKCIFLYA